MVDFARLFAPGLATSEGFRDFREALDDHLPAIERDIAALRQSPHDAELTARLFRALHTVKGDAALCKIELGVAIAHPLETVLARCRAGELIFSDLIAELMLLALDRLELALDALAEGRSLEALRLPTLLGGLERLAIAAAETLAAEAANVIEAVTGFRPRQTTAEFAPAAVIERAPPSQAADLWFFASLAYKLEERSPLFAGRTARLLRLALDTNREAGQPIDTTQLAAAVYLHDVGMTFLPERVWLTSGLLSEEDRQRLRDHPVVAAGLLARMPGWQAAAEMVRQHHEMPCGSGYPEGLTAPAICPGAKLLAIVDAFEAITLKHAHRGQNRSLIRAIAEINANDHQFAPEWIAPFNRVVRRLAEEAPAQVT